MNDDEQAIAAVLKQYEAALNGGDIAAVAALYAPDGVLMPQNAAASVGAEAIRRTYDGMAGALRFSIAFTVAELRQLAPDWAFARTTSAGTIGITANGASVPEANQELFVFQKLGGAWKIARYCFCTTLPAQA